MIQSLGLWVTVNWTVHLLRPNAFLNPTHLTLILTQPVASTLQIVYLVLVRDPSPSTSQLIGSWVVARLAIMCDEQVDLQDQVTIGN